MATSLVWASKGFGRFASLCGDQKGGRAGRSVRFVFFGALVGPKGGYGEASRRRPDRLLSEKTMNSQRVMKE